MSETRWKMELQHYMGGRMKLVTYRDLPDETIREDYRDTLRDIEVCKRAIATGVLTYSGGTVHERLEINLEIKATIEGEATRRGIVLL